MFGLSGKTKLINIVSILPKADWIWQIATIIINHNEMIKLQNIYKIHKKSLQIIRYASKSSIHWGGHSWEITPEITSHSTVISH